MAKLTRDEVAKLARRSKWSKAIGDLISLSCEDLSDLDLSNLDLSNLSLANTDLSGANLTGANLTGTEFDCARLSGVRWDGIVLENLDCYRCLLIPTPDEWRTRVGHWEGTIDELQALGERGNGHPAGPLLRAWLDLCQAHIAVRPNVIPELARIHGGTR